MHRDQAFCNEESKLSPLSSWNGRGHFREFVEELFDMTRVNPAAGIGDTGSDTSLGGCLEVDGDVSARRCKLNGIADEIPENLFQFVAIPLDRW